MSKKGLGTQLREEFPDVYYQRAGIPGDWQEQERNNSQAESSTLNKMS